MSSEYTRRSHLLNSSIQVGRHSASRSEESYASRLPTSGAASKYLASRYTETDTTENDDFKNYDSLLRRIRAEQEQSLNTSSMSSNSSYSTSPLNRSRSPGAFSDGPRESFLHSRHQEIMRARRLLDANNQIGSATSGGAVGPDYQQQQQEQQFATNSFDNATRPTYSVRNIPVRCLDDVRETIAIRRQYYRERLFGKNEEENTEENGNENREAGAAATNADGLTENAENSENSEGAEAAAAADEEAETPKADEINNFDEEIATSADSQAVQYEKESIANGESETIAGNNEMTVEQPVQNTSTEIEATATTAESVSAAEEAVYTDKVSENITTTCTYGANTDNGTVVITEELVSHNKNTSVDVEIEETLEPEVHVLQTASAESTASAEESDEKDITKVDISEVAYVCEAESVNSSCTAEEKLGEPEDHTDVAPVLQTPEADGHIGFTEDQ